MRVLDRAVRESLRLARLVAAPLGVANGAIMIAADRAWLVGRRLIPASGPSSATPSRPPERPGAAGPGA